MKVVVINGTAWKGVTYRLKEVFLEPLRKEHEVQEFVLPRDSSNFCTGCKNCFYKSEELCPHASETMPIWNAMLAADLLVFAYPVYVMRAPGQVKALLDHFGCHWMVHRPDKRMFNKRAVILTQSIGAPNGAAQKDVSTSLNWLGVSDVRTLGFGLMEGVIWDELSPERREKMTNKVRKLASEYITFEPARMSVKVRAYFAVAKILHQRILAGEETPSADNQHWLEQGWIKR